MKTTIIKYMTLAILLILTLGFSGCSNDSEDGLNHNEYREGSNDNDIIYPIDNLSKEVLSFFHESLPDNMVRSSVFFVDSKSDEVHLVNSQKELKSLYSGNQELPAIDFNHLTLVIGQCQMSEGGYLVKQQFVENRGGIITLNLHVYQSLDFAPQVLTQLYYWGLYPKISNKTITVDIIKK